jgi:hypothetical protein
LQAAGRERLDQLDFPRAVSIHSVHAGQMTRAAKRQRRADQQDGEAGPEIMALRITSRLRQSGQT